MKKHLRGKRYIRSRASVQVGRINRQIYKVERAVAIMGNYDWTGAVCAFESAVSIVAYRLSELPADFAKMSATVISALRDVGLVPSENQE
jgi:ribosomal protein L18E